MLTMVNQCKKRYRFQYNKSNNGIGRALFRKGTDLKLLGYTLGIRLSNILEYQMLIWIQFLSK